MGESVEQLQGPGDELRHEDHQEHDDELGNHERDDALQLLSPPFPPVRIISKTGGIQVGTRVELRIGFVSWVALHIAYEPNVLFIDEQIRGPFARWVHRHEFEDLGCATRLTDRIDYMVRGGPWINAISRWLVHGGLYQMFQYRHRVTKQFCEKA